MQSNRDLTFEELSPWWEHAVVLVMALGFSLLIWRSVQTYTDAPPIPLRATTSNGEVVYTREDIVGGQNVFMKFGLMDNGTIGGHGAYVGPDFSADYLHGLSGDMARAGISSEEVQRLLTENRVEHP
jgi:nitric oxide reductase subunit B